MKCPHCDCNHPDGTKFCPNTGKKIELLACQNHECPEYGKQQYPLNAKYCPKCGLKLSPHAQDSALVILESERESILDSEGERISLISSDGKVLYSSEESFQYGDYLISENAIYISCNPGETDRVNSEWIQIDKWGNQKVVGSEIIPIVNGYSGQPDWYGSIRKRLFELKHPSVYTTEYLGRFGKKCLFVAYTEEQLENSPKGASVYDEDFNIVYTIKNDLCPKGVFNSGNFLVRDSRTGRYGIIDELQNTILPCIYKREISEEVDGIYRISRTEKNVVDDKRIYDSKNKKWYDDCDRQYLYEYIEEDDSYRVLNGQSGNIICDTKFSPNSWIFPDGFVIINTNDNDLLCKGDKIIRLEPYEMIQSFKDAELYVSEGRIITSLSNELGNIVRWRIRNYDGEIIKELDPSYEMRRGYRNGKALFIKEYSNCRQVGFIDLDGHITILPYPFPLERGFDIMDDDAEYVELIDVDCEFVSENTIMVNNDTDSYLIGTDGSVIFDKKPLLVRTFNVLSMFHEGAETICDGKGKVLYNTHARSVRVVVLK